jgi:hypothetical protein
MNATFCTFTMLCELTEHTRPDINYFKFEGQSLSNTCTIAVYYILFQNMQCVLLGIKHFSFIINIIEGDKTQELQMARPLISKIMQPQT